MTVVMFHSGKSLPSFLECNFQQFRLFNPDVNVYFITDREHLHDSLFTLYNIFPIDKSTCYSNDIRHFEVLFGRGEDDFWTITTTRLMYVRNFILNKNFNNVFHFENDVLIYSDLMKLSGIFINKYNDLSITYGGPDKAMTGMFFIAKPKALEHMLDFIMDLIKEHKVREIRKIYGMDMVNEMTLIRAYSTEYPQLIPSLPILPFGEWSDGVKEFESIFDPASWGQYVGGTLDGIPGAKPDDHYIGQLLRKYLNYTVIWNLENGKKIPYFKYEGIETKINNLHIHSKNLHLYMSNGKFIPA